MRFTITNMRDSVFELRNRLGLTQQELAVKLGWSVSTAARYESSRMPEPKALAQLAMLAKRESQPDLMRAFLSTLAGSLGVDAGELADALVHAEVERMMAEVPAFRAG